MIVGSRVEQRITINHAQCQGDPDDFEIKVALAGVVVACDRSGSPAEYVALVMRDDGTLGEVPARLLTVTELISGAPIGPRPKKKDKKAEETAS